MNGKKPVVLFVYNRPDLTYRTLNAIRLYAPNHLMIVSDGAKGCEIDAARVGAVREICNTINWPCHVSRQYSESNQGCRTSITSGLEWVFSQVDSAIILEDDCLPDASFFEFCATLLDHYHSNPQIMCIGGFRAAKQSLHVDTSYQYSKYPATWGWATWKRAYTGYDQSLAQWSEHDGLRWLSQHLESERFARYWAHMFNRAQSGSNDWDYAWAYHCWRKNGLSIHPRVNLIQNIGFGSNATHTTEANHPLARINASPIALPLAHPTSISLDFIYETLMEEILYSGIRRRQLQMLHTKIKDCENLHNTQ